MKVLVIFAHPDLKSSRQNAALIKAISSEESITIQPIYDEYPDWQIDVAKEQQLVESHDRIVFQFPLYWYSTPPLLKKWQDDVLAYGWAYGEGGDALKGKEFIAAATIGGHPEVYRAGGRNHFTMSEILRPLQATANICEMHYLPAYITGGHLDDDGLEKAAKEYAAYITDSKPRGIAH